ncbi:hypothetical protein M405DRAFT_860847 [Rhizopogon salebrosus TDB-379]|nr:hypothetical protein M405DRAFT_860847 [Rhizopogon salebrosus TDB-379]
MKTSSTKSKKHNDLPAARTSSEANETQGDTVIQTLGVTIAVINTTKDLVPIDLAKNVLGTIGSIMGVVQSVIKNKSDFLALVNKCDTITRILARATEGVTDDDLRGSLRDALSELYSSVNRINNEVATKSKRKYLRRFFSVVIDRDQISGWERDLDRVIVLFNTEAIAGIAVRVGRLALGLGGNASDTNALKHRPMVPPSRPSIFYGRDTLLEELTGLVVNEKHIALIGPGGMGKSSLAKAILNQPLIAERFADRRFFVTYDALDPSTITFEAFMARLAEALGTTVTGSDPMYQISTFLALARALVVLDNAETFEEANGSSIHPAISQIADIPGVTLILTSRSRRNAPNVSWITKDIPSLDLSSAKAAFFQIYHQPRGIDAEDGVATLLTELEFHPLSINLLANAAQKNSWSLATLVKRWDDRHSKVLDYGKGKLQSLSDTMQLSISSPSIQDLGEGGRNTLAVIAFLPQGLNENLAGDLLPSLPQVNAICDVLCTQSLVYRQAGFAKMLAPIRHYVQDSLPPPDPICLRDIRAFYYGALGQQRANSVDVIKSDHINIEHIIALGLTAPHGAEEACGVCFQFLQFLVAIAPRPTSLAPAIFKITENSSTWKRKGTCLFTLGSLYDILSRFTEGIKTFQAAEVLFLAASDHERVAACVTKRADVYTKLGRFIQSKRVLENFEHSDSWEHLDKPTKVGIWFGLDVTRMHTFTSSVPELFPTGETLHRSGDIAQVGRHVEDLLLQCIAPFERLHVLQLLAEVAFVEGRLSNAMDFLQEALDSVKGKDPQLAFRWNLLKAVVATHQGNYDLARQLTQRPLESLVLPDIVGRLYNSAEIELAAGDYHRAESLFDAAIEGCNMQGHLYVKAISFRGLGEIAFARGKNDLASQRFAEAQSQCSEMGVPPRNIYSCKPFYALPKRFEGWVLFLEGNSRFANKQVV